MNSRPELGEPNAWHWQAESLEDVVRRLLPATGQRLDRPWIVAVDGRSGAGKTTLVNRLLARVPDSAVLHTDDVAWHLSFFDWADELRNGLLQPLLQGDAVSYRPPGWVARERPGAITVPAGCSVVWVEGSGSSRRELSELIDVSIWVQCDNIEARRRLHERDGQEEEDLHREWEAEEIPFLLEDRPWERAAVVVAGRPALEHDPDTQVITAHRGGTLRNAGTWKSMVDSNKELLLRKTGHDVSWWVDRAREEGLASDAELRGWMRNRHGVTGYAQYAVAWEMFGYPDYLLRDADDLLDGQYEDHPGLRPIADAVLAWAAATEGVAIQLRKGYVSLHTPRRKFAQLTRKNSTTVDLALRISAPADERLEAIKVRLGDHFDRRIRLRSPEDVDAYVQATLARAVEQNM